MSLKLPKKTRDMKKIVDWGKIYKVIRSKRQDGKENTKYL